MNERVPVKQAAEELGIPPRTVRAYMRSGRINIGTVIMPDDSTKTHRYLIYRSKLDKYTGGNA